MFSTSNVTVLALYAGKALPESMIGRTESATLGGGCFWCIEAVFAELRGVEKVESGYSGGTVPNPTYQQVCSGATGHAEVVRITFDPRVVSYKQLLEIFFTVHDPTTLNRQGADVGTQYRSAIFYETPEQKSTAEQVLKDVQGSGTWNAPIVTQLEPFKAFYPAEDYHRNYFKNNPRQPYCQLVITPKVRKFRYHYLKMLKPASHA
jgi:peptide-methionine (S)-S-oxide reductase